MFGGNLSTRKAVEPLPAVGMCWFGVIRKKAAIELVGDGMGNRVNGYHCTGDVDRPGTGSSSLSPFASDMGE
jgi:hypothetical protein